MPLLQDPFMSHHICFVTDLAIRYNIPVATPSHRIETPRFSYNILHYSFLADTVCSVLPKIHCF